MKKRCTSMLLALSLVVTMMVAGAMPASAKILSVVGLGDSITTGYGLDGYTADPAPFAEDSYINLLSEKLYLAPINFAVDGQTVATLLAQLEAAEGAMADSIAAADKIFITIGGNDLLLAMFTELATALELNMASETFLDELKAEIGKALMGDAETLAKVQAGMAAFAASIPAIIPAFQEDLKAVLVKLTEMNPDAVVVLQTIANPYQDMVPFGPVIQGGLDAINGVLELYAQGENVELVDVCHTFAASEEDLFHTSSLDPHPNAAGHKVIADLIEDLMIPANKFEDIAGHWGEYAIAYAAEKGYMNGTGESIFNPNMVMDRAMFVTVLGRMSGADVDAYEDCGFTDVNHEAYYHKYLNWAVAEGIVQGITTDTFDPHAPVQRQAMAVLLNRYAGYMEYNYPPTLPGGAFDDADSISNYAKEAVKTMKDLGIMMGKDGNNFMPTDSATRAECATVLFRFANSVIEFNPAAPVEPAA